jgi:hypothetical protein
MNAKPQTTEDQKDAGDTANFWHLQLEMAERARMTWRDDARMCVQRYKADQESIARKTSAAKRFNIFFSNVETLKGALYGRTAKADVRRRYPDKATQPARDAALVLERGLMASAQCYDIDKTVEAALHDHLVTGIAEVRVCYEPVIKQAPAIGPDGMPVMGADGQPVTQDVIADQKLYEEYVYWDDYLESPARKAEDVWWKGYRHAMTRDDLRENGFKNPDAIPLNWQPDITGRKDVPDDLKRAEVWEIWHKPERERLWIVKGYPTILRTDDDPYGLEEFWPGPDSYRSVDDTDTRVPRPEFLIYKDQADDLDEITARISRLTKALKRRGVYDASVKELKRLANAADNEFIPVDSYAKLSERGGLQAAFQTEDIGIIAKTLIDLMNQRQMLVQAIYEVTGISDVLRGSTDPNETLGAQNLKAQFGSQRLKKRQRSLQRWIRDIYRIKAEILAEHFEPSVLQEMTGVEVTPEIMQILRTDKTRAYNVDIETDSTIFEDTAAERQQVTETLKGITEFVVAWVPVLQLQPALLNLAFELLAMAVRTLKVNRSVEDAIDEAKAQLQQAAAMAQQQPPPQDPKLEAAKVKAQAEIGKAQATQQQTGMNMQFAQQKHAMDMQKMEAQAALSALQPAPGMVQ